MLPFPSYGKCVCRSFYGKIIQTCTAKHFISAVHFKQTTRKWCKCYAMQQSPVCINLVVLMAKARQIQPYRLRLLLRAVYVFIYLYQKNWSSWIFEEQMWNLMAENCKKSTCVLSVTAFWKIFVLATCTQRHWSRFKWIVTTHCLWRKTISSVLLCCLVFEVLDGVWEMLGCVCKRTTLWRLVFLGLPVSGLDLVCVCCVN